MTLVRYEPWSLHREVLSEFNRMLDRFGSNDDAAAADWVPAVDIEEHRERYVIRADLPGVDPAAVEVTLEDGVLTLAGARAAAGEANGAEARRIERASGRFLRRFSLPDTVDAEAIQATGKHGVVEIVIPKREAAKPRKIAVNG